MNSARSRFGDDEFHREAARRRIDDGLRQFAGRRDLSLRLRPEHRIDLRLDDAARIGVERNLGVIARLHLVQFVLAEQREDLPVLVDERHHIEERHAGHEGARTKLHVDHRAVARRDHRRLRQLPACVVELRAGGVDLGFRHAQVRLGGRNLRLHLGDRSQVLAHAAGELSSTCCCLGAAPRQFARSAP